MLGEDGQKSTTHWLNKSLQRASKAYIQCIWNSASYFWERRFQCQLKLYKKYYFQNIVNISKHSPRLKAHISSVGYIYICYIYYIYILQYSPMLLCIFKCSTLFTSFSSPCGAEVPGCPQNHNNPPFLVYNILGLCAKVKIFSLFHMFIYCSC